MKIVKTDQVIIKEGEKSSFLYKVLKGSFARYINYGEENEFLINVIGIGESFGEVGFFTEIPSEFTIVAVSESVVLEVEKDNFQQFIVQNPKNVIDILTSMANTIGVLQYHNNELMDELLDKYAKEKHGTDDLKRKVEMYKNYRF